MKRIVGLQKVNAKMKTIIAMSIVVVFAAFFMEGCSTAANDSETDILPVLRNAQSFDDDDSQNSNSNNGSVDNGNSENGNVDNGDSDNGNTNNSDSDNNKLDNEGKDDGSLSSDADNKNTSYDFTVCFAGDINLDDDTTTTTYLNSVGGDIGKCISPELIEIMNDADVMCLNNEFPYTTRGEETPGKLVHFRANPDKVKYLFDLGVDVVSLANNHVYDYGEYSLLDTLSTLDEAGIGRVGAGKNVDEAMEPYYTTIQGKTIAIVAASRAEKNIKTPCATKDSSGVLYCYDTTLFKQEIAKAKEEADIVIAFVHWGTEYSTVLEDEQVVSAKEYIDAGADVIIGAHSHCLQGMEIYKGKPIIYSLGNYWFNDKTLDTMLVQLHFTGDSENDELSVKVIPAVQSECKTTIASTKEEQERIFLYLEGISINVTIDDEGLIKEK